MENRDCESARSRRRERNGVKVIYRPGSGHDDRDQILCRVEHAGTAKRCKVGDAVAGVAGRASDQKTLVVIGTGEGC
jgi:hypothetical protein